MKIILKERIENLGKIGDVVEVKDGFARNYLLPKEKAVLYSAENIKYIEAHRKKLEIIAAKQESEAREIAQAIEGVVVKIKAKTASEGRLYGSVSASDIAEQLKLQKIEVDKKKILISEPIKTTGEHIVRIRLYPDVEPEIKVVVESEQE